MSTTRRSRSSSKGKTKANDLYRAFEASVLRKAKKIIADYRIILEKNDSLGFIGSSVELPTVFANASTAERCYEATQEALTVAVATMIESGQRPPQPASARKRTVQVNVRLTAEEKLQLTTVATARGFKGISDFIRNAAIRQLSEAG